MDDNELEIVSNESSRVSFSFVSLNSGDIDDKDKCFSSLNNSENSRILIHVV